jgi:hypothetical protein
VQPEGAGVRIVDLVKTVQQVLVMDLPGKLARPAEATGGQSGVSVLVRTQTVLASSALPVTTATLSLITVDCTRSSVQNVRTRALENSIVVPPHRRTPR